MCLRLLIVLLLSLASCGPQSNTVPTESDDHVLKFEITPQLVERFASKSKSEKLPRLTALFPDVTMEQAYDLQANWVALKLKEHGGIGGIKGGVVTPGAMKTFAVTEPICGILPASGRVQYVENMQYTLHCPGTKLETEIGFVLASDIAVPLDNLDDFVSHLAGICPIIELPCGQWEAPAGTPDPRDFAAINLTAHDYIVGPLSPLDTDPIKFELYKESTPLHTADGSSNWKGPLETAMYLANFGLRQGVKMKAGSTIICGALGSVHDALPGTYTLSCEGLEDMAFSIADH